MRAKTAPGGRRTVAAIEAAQRPAKPTPGQQKAFEAGRSFESKRREVSAGGSAQAVKLPLQALRSQGQRRAFLAGRMFEAAKTTRVNSKHWTDATQLDANSGIGPAVLALRNRSRWEFYNNGYARGMVKSYASDLIGPEGPSLKVLSVGLEAGADGKPQQNREFNDALEWAWYDWCEVCDLSGQQEFVDLLSNRIDELWHAGEFFIQLKSDAKAPGPVKLRLLVIEPDRVSTPIDKTGDLAITDGIKHDANGKPSSYFVMKRHPGSTRGEAYTSEYEEVPASDMVHVYVKERAGQTRGYPWLGPTLEVWAQIRDFITDTLLAARVAAMFSGFVYTDHPQIALDDLAGELPIFDMEPGTLTTLPAGWKFAQSQPQHPSTTFKEFKREMLAEAGRPQGIPYLKLAADAAGHNYSSARMDDNGYWGALASVLGWLGRTLLKRLLKLVEAELRFGGQLPAVKRWRPLWVGAIPKHADPVKEAEAARIPQATKINTRERECNAQGLDSEEVLEANGATAKRCKELGLPSPFVAAGKANPAAAEPRSPKPKAQSPKPEEGGTDDEDE